MRICSIVFLLLITVGLAIGQKYPAPPSPPRLVTDFTSTLAADEHARLEEKLRNYYDSTSTQIAVVILTTLDGYPIDDYSINLAKQWGIGKKDKDNGVLILISKEERKIFIANGYGMEGVLTDGRTKRIIEQDIKPSFKEGAYFDGLNKGTDRIIQYASGEFVADDEANPQEPIAIIFSVLLFVAIALLIHARKVKRYAIVNNLPFWTAWHLLSNATVTHRGSWGGFSSGSGGGGFSGFGGGGFGGGGAGGSW
ncbi:MAG: TPM domain-containing protein [Bacteroidota bacterium]